MGGSPSLILCGLEIERGKEEEEEREKEKLTGGGGERTEEERREWQNEEDEDGDFEKGGKVFQCGEGMLDDHSWFSKERITHIVSICHRTVGSEVLQSRKIPATNILHVNISDTSKANLERYFEQFSLFIHSARMDGANVVIHCTAGVSRSSTITLAYLMAWLDLPFSKAFPYLVRQRPAANPNPGFVGQLKKWESSEARKELHKKLKEHENKQKLDKLFESDVDWFVQPGKPCPVPKIWARDDFSDLK